MKDKHITVRTVTHLSLKFSAQKKMAELLKNTQKSSLKPMAVGYELIDMFYVDSAAGEVRICDIDNQRDEEESYCVLAYVGKYRINLWCDNGMPVYPYMHVLVNSIHTK